MSGAETTSRIPVAVREAISNFVPRRGFVVVHRQERDVSFIYDWGVRIRQQAMGDKRQIAEAQGVDASRDDSPDEATAADAAATSPTNAASGPRSVAWICLATESCRQNMKLIALPRGFTSKACDHLKKDHGILSNKRRRKLSASARRMTSSRSFRNRSSTETTLSD
jgi:hypothetical protein